ncbi:unnamed protein product [Acanthoscelides obtectus]|uniref:Uncharacterized protein n=1 Tax=Acanthoscelides obtectus TaxID=200917 RepID=A0A9P0LBE4_ACAOB|nr:unnamed protein product [Acanthoscelides obtectus]CAK1674483.1 Zinc finger protein 92 homolog [Acanthoscelides obtectus]
MKTCFKCGSSSKDDRSIVLFNVPSSISNPVWHYEFLKRLAVENLQQLNIKVEDIRVCDKHFKTEDLEMNHNHLVLKENALPLKEECEQFEVSPEIVYMDGTEEIEDGESRELAQLAPVVQYEYVANQEVQASPVPGIPVITAPQLISIMQEDGTVIEPVMPFFLSQSPMFTVLNGSNENGETIILQIENQEEEDAKVKVEVVEPLEESQTTAGETDGNEKISEGVVTAVSSWEHCEPKQNNMENVYVCEICEKSYCCVNCLKSHYEAMHIAKTQGTRYKCKFTSMQKSLYCPVCEVCFENSKDTLDHYLTHSVACDVCGSGFDRQKLLVEHMIMVHNKVNCYESYECEFCKAIYQYHWNLTKHYQVYHKMILCYICKSRFPTVTDLQEHQRTHVQKINILPYACSKCNKAFPQISDIAVHIRREHSSRKSSLNSDNYIGHTASGGKSKTTVDSMIKKKRIKVK